MHKSLILVGLLILVSGLFGGTALAETLQRNEVTLAVGACQAALPAHEGSFRKRPLGMRNEGTSSAFLSCSATSDYLAPGWFDVSVSFTNPTAEPVSINCTLVDAISTPAGVYFPKSIVVNAFSTSGVTWQATVDNGGQNFRAPAYSCLIPQGVELNQLLQQRFEQVGS